MRCRSTGWCWVLLAGFVGTTACGGATTPHRTIDRYADALEVDDADAAWHLLTPEAQRRIGRARFDVAFARRREAGYPLVDALREADKTPATLSAHLAFGEGEHVWLTYTDAGWRVAGGLSTPYAQRTPRESAWAFVQAIRAQNAQALLRLSPAAWRAQLTPDQVGDWLSSNQTLLEALADRIADALDGDWIESSQRATLVHAAGRLSLILEDGRWVVQSFQ